MGLCNHRWRSVWLSRSIRFSDAHMECHLDLFPTQSQSQCHYGRHFWVVWCLVGFGSRLDWSYGVPPTARALLPLLLGWYHCGLALAPSHMLVFTRCTVIIFGLLSLRSWRGPMAYWGGVATDALIISSSQELFLGMIAIEWAIAFPFLLWAGQHMQRKYLLHHHKCRELSEVQCSFIPRIPTFQLRTFPLPMRFAFYRQEHQLRRFRYLSASLGNRTDN